VILRLGDLDLSFDRPLNPGGLAVKRPELSESPHPGSVITARGRVAARELLLEGLRYEGSERLSAFNGSCFGSAKDWIRNLEGGLHGTISPYLWLMWESTASSQPSRGGVAHEPG